MSDKQQAPVAQTFTFEKKMGADVLTFTVSVLLLGVEDPEPAIPAPKGSGLPNLPATSGESLWFVTVKGPQNTNTTTYASYIADTQPEQVARWALPFPVGDLVKTEAAAIDPSLPPLFRSCTGECKGETLWSDGCSDCEGTGRETTAAGGQVMDFLSPVHSALWREIDGLKARLQTAAN